MRSTKLFVAAAAALLMLCPLPVEAARIHSKEPAAGDAPAKARAHRATKPDARRQTHPQKRRGHRDSSLDWPQLG